jgi:hypothetical protein
LEVKKNLRAKEKVSATYLTTTTTTIIEKGEDLLVYY